MPTPDGPISLYVAMRSPTEPVPTQASDDLTGLRELVDAFPGQTLTVEPALAKAGKQLGLRRARLPPELVYLKATMTVACATAGMLEPDVGPPLIGDFLDAAISFMEAKPWRFVEGDTPLRLEVVSDGQRRTVEAALMGQRGREYGLMLYMEPGALHRILLASELEQVQLGESADILSGSMEREPDWAARTIKETLGVRVVPMPMRLVDGDPRPTTRDELTMLAAALRAASKIRRGTTAVRSKSAGTPPVEVELHIPGGSAPRSSGRDKVGRNSPCPCGSGRKYKRCCLAEDEAVERSRPARAPAPSLEVQLVHEIVELADEEHFGWRDPLPPSWHELAEQPEGIQLLMPLLAFQREVAPKQTAAASFVDRRGATLSPEARALLRAQHEVVLSVWQVLDVQPGVSVEVICLLTGARARVYEVMGSRGMRFRDCVLARVVTEGGRSQFSGLHPRVLSPAAAREVVAEIRTLVSLRVKPVPPSRLAAPEVVDALLTQWHAALARQAAVVTVDREIHNTDGEPFAPHEDEFAIDRKQWREVVSAIVELPGVYLDEQTSSSAELTFTKPGNAMHSHWRSTVIGSARVDARRLTLETNSRARIDHLRAMLERALGSRIVHRTRKTSPVRTVKRAGDEGPVAMDATRTGGLWAQPQELMLREQARHFIDDPLSALDGRTPRQAMATARGRRALHQWLEQSEHRASAAPGVVGSSGAVVRELLGLSVTGEVVPRTAEERRLGGGRKISETLLDFASPLLLEMDDDRSLRPVLELAAMVWNADVIDRERRRSGPTSLIKRITNELTTQSTPFEDLEAVIGPRLEELAQRRRKFFADDRRLIEVLDVRSQRDGHIYVQAAARLASPLSTSKTKPSSRDEQPKRRLGKQLDLLE